MLAKRVIAEDSIVAKRRRLRDIIYNNSLLKDKEFLLSSGAKSEYYFDMKMTTQDPEGSSLVGDVLLDYVLQFDCEYLGGLATGAIAPMALVCAKSWDAGHPIAGFFVRDERKTHGTQKLIDGFIKPGASVIIVDDVTTEGKSAMKAVRAVQGLGCKVVRVVSLVDRQAGATESFKREGLVFESIFKTDDFR
jgi:orotate phosphoribosyltransferase